MNEEVLLTRKIQSRIPQRPKGHQEARTFKLSVLNRQQIVHSIQI